MFSSGKLGKSQVWRRSETSDRGAVPAVVDVGLLTTKMGTKGGCFGARVQFLGQFVIYMYMHIYIHMYYDPRVRY